MLTLVWITWFAFLATVALYSRLHSKHERLKQEHEDVTNAYIEHVRMCEVEDEAMQVLLNTYNDTLEELAKRTIKEAR